MRVIWQDLVIELMLPHIYVVWALCENASWLPAFKGVQSMTV